MRYSTPHYARLRALCYLFFARLVLLVLFVRGALRASESIISQSVLKKTFLTKIVTFLLAFFERKGVQPWPLRAEWDAACVAVADAAERESKRQKLLAAALQKQATAKKARKV